MELRLATSVTRPRIFSAVVFLHRPLSTRHASERAAFASLWRRFLACSLPGSLALAPTGELTGELSLSFTHRLAQSSLDGQVTNASPFDLPPWKRRLNLFVVRIYSTAAVAAPRLLLLLLPQASSHTIRRRRRQAIPNVVAFDPRLGEVTTKTPG